MKKDNNEKMRQELASAYKRLFTSSDDGKKVLKDLKLFCGFKKTSVTLDNPNAHRTMYLEGMRRVFLRINSFMEITNAGKK